MFVVNVADLMSRWTNDLYVSRLQRASNFNLSEALGRTHQAPSLAVDRALLGSRFGPRVD